MNTETLAPGVYIVHADGSLERLTDCVVIKSRDGTQSYNTPKDIERRLDELQYLKAQAEEKVIQERFVDEIQWPVAPKPEPLPSIDKQADYPYRATVPRNHGRYSA